MAQLQNLERDGFQLTKKVFTNPPDMTSFDPVRKRKMTICNLFVEHRLSMRDIVRVLDEKYDHVVSVLIEQKLVFERRKNPRNVEAERGARYSSRSWKVARRPEELFERGRVKYEIQYPATKQYSVISQTASSKSSLEISGSTWGQPCNNGHMPHRTSSAMWAPHTTQLSNGSQCPVAQHRQVV